MLIPLALPRGFFKNGTPYSAKNRWADGNLVRWIDGSIKPHGGVARVVQKPQGTPLANLIPDISTEGVRGMFRWRELNGKVWTVVGTNLKLWAIDQNGNVFDITPADLITQTKDGDRPRKGYGIGLYSKEAYSTPRSGLEEPFQYLSSWTFDSWGEDLICSLRANNQKIYQWTPGDPQAVQVSNSPLHSRGVSVTAQRHLMSIYSIEETRLVQWSDSEDNTLWAPNIDNQAGSQILSGQGQLRAIVSILAGELIIGDNDVHLARYLGPPYIFGFERIGDNTSIVSANSVVVIGGIAFWWGDRSFWVYNGSQVASLPCEVMDFLITDVSREGYPKIEAYDVSDFNEVWWHYPSKASPNGENDSYVIYNYVNNWWATGKLDRTAGVDSMGFTRPWKVTEDGTLYEHELPEVNPQNESYIISGPLEVGNGETMLYADRIYPDTPPTLGDPSDADSPAARITILGRDFPNAVEREYGPYALDRPTNIRARGRELRVRVDFSTALVEQGIARLNVKAGGER